MTLEFRAMDKRCQLRRRSVENGIPASFETSLLTHGKWPVSEIGLTSPLPSPSTISPTYLAFSFFLLFSHDSLHCSLALQVTRFLSFSCITNIMARSKTTWRFSNSRQMQQKIMSNQEAHKEFDTKKPWCHCREVGEGRMIKCARDEEVGDDYQ